MIQTKAVNSPKRFEITLAIKIFLIVLLVLAVLIPLFFIFSAMTSVDIGKVLLSYNFLRALLNSLLVGLTSTAISIVFAFTIAFVLTRVRIRLTGILAVVFCVPMLIPSISHGMGIIVLLGNNGVLTRLFGLGEGLNGFWAIVLGSVMYSFPTAFLMLSDIFKYEDRSVYEAADIMGIPKHRQFTGITLPYLFKPLISVVFATFTLVFTDYGVPMMVGGRFTTLPLFMYNEVIGQLNFGIGAIVAIVLILPAVGAFIFDLFKKDAGNLHYSVKDVQQKRNRKKEIAAYVYCAVSAVIILLPIVVFSVMGFVKKYPLDMSFSFANIANAFDMKAGQFLINSLVIALLVGVIGTAVSYFTAYLTARTRSKWNRYLHLMSIISLAIPGMVLGISYSLMYKGSFLSGTLAMLILVNIVHFFSSPYLLCYNALNKVNKNYEVVAKTLQISKARLVKDVLVPQTFDTILEMFAYFFVNSMVTISAVAFLYVSTTMPLSLLINSFETLMMIECAAAVSLMILLINGVLKTAIYLYRRIVFRKTLKVDLEKV